MLHKLIAVSALATFAAAQLSENSTITRDPQQISSIVQVLETALPSSLLAEVLTNQAAVSSEIASEFAAGSTPAWFTALPTDVQTFFIPDAAYPNATGSLVPSVTANASTTATNSAASNMLTTVTSTQTAGSESASESGGPSATASQSSSTSSGSATMPSALVRMSLVGAVGLVGVFAL